MRPVAHVVLLLTIWNLTKRKSIRSEWDHLATTPVHSQLLFPVQASPALLPMPSFPSVFGAVRPGAGNSNGSAGIEIYFSLSLERSLGPTRREAVQGLQGAHKVIRLPRSFCFAVLPRFLTVHSGCLSYSFIPTFQAAGWTKGRRKHCFLFYIL